MRFDLDADHAAVIFQLSKELPNLSDDRLAATGATRDGVVRLLAVLRAARRATSPDDPLRVEVDDPAVLSILAPDAAQERARATWATWLEGVVQALGERELFLRTGHRPDAIARAIDRLRSPDDASTHAP